MTKTLLVPCATCRVVPEQTQLTLHTYSIHRDQRYIHNHEVFLPERWLSSKGDAADAPAGEHNMAASIPFSYGPASCVGKNLAMMEMRMVLCWMLRRFRFSKAPGVRYECVKSSDICLDISLAAN